MNSEIAKRVRGLRKMLGMTQADLARVSGVTQSAISKIEGRENTNIQGETLNSLCRALKTNPEYLLRGTGAVGPLVPTSADNLELQAILSELGPDDIDFLLTTARALRDRVPRKASPHNPFPIKNTK